MNVEFIFNKDVSMFYTKENQIQKIVLIDNKSLLVTDDMGTVHFLKHFS